MEKSVVWKPIPGLENYLEASTTGFIRTVPRVIPSNGWGGFRKIGVKILKASTNKKGYLSLTHNHIAQRSIVVHRLIALTFLPNPDNKPQVNHIDGNKQNNCVENLEWCTARENVAHAYKTGLSNLFGENNHNAIFTVKDIIAIKTRIANGESNPDISKDYGVDKNRISQIRNGYTWSHVTI